MKVQVTTKHLLIPILVTHYYYLATLALNHGIIASILRGLKVSKLVLLLLLLVASQVAQEMNCATISTIEYEF